MAWDHDLKAASLSLIVAGSHVGMMVKMQEYQAPLYGRFTARLLVEPLSFAALTQFLPHYDLAQRVAVYAILGGIPAYLERFDSRKTLATNVQEEILADTGMFRVEPFYLLSDEVREPRNYMAVLRAIGQGNHTLETITLGAGFQTKQHTSTYLGRLQDLRLIPHLWEIIRDQMRAFVGMTAFEELCREWVLQQAIRGALPFMPDRVGSHWSKNAQIDVVAIRWDEKQILLGEAKWGKGNQPESIDRLDVQSPRSRGKRPRSCQTKGRAGQCITRCLPAPVLPTRPGPRQPAPSASRRRGAGKRSAATRPAPASWRAWGPRPSAPSRPSSSGGAR